MDRKPGLDIPPQLRDGQNGGVTPGIRPNSVSPGNRLPGLPGTNDRDRDGGRGDDRRDRTPSVPGLPGRVDDATSRFRPGRTGIDLDPPDNDKRPVKQLRIEPTDRLADRVRDARAADALENLVRARTPDQLQAEFTKLRSNDAVRNDPSLAALNLDRVSGRFQLRIRENDFRPLVESRAGQKYQLDRQYSLLDRGDPARQLRFSNALVDRGGWSRRPIGPVVHDFTRHSFSAWYPGPRWYPRYCWQPMWSPWVRWSFWGTVLPIYDPRPFVVRPIYYDPCPVVTIYEYPVWQPLPVDTAGTWVDVPPVVIDAGNDLQMLAIRFVDPGHTEQNLGPRFRVWIRSNSRQPIQQPVDVTLFASNDRQLASGALQAGVTIPEIQPGMIIPIDIRLPVEVNRMSVDQEGSQVPFQFLHAVVDSRNAVPEVDKTNNGAIVDRGEIFPVDPAAFSIDVTAAAPQSVVTLAGEGLGPEPGELIVTVGNQQFSAEIRGWYDLGVQFTVPNISSVSAVDAQVVVIRGDGAASNPVPLSIAPDSMIGTLPMAPAPGGAPGPAIGPLLGPIE